MSQIKAKDTKPELMVRKFLFSKGYRYRLHDKRLPGKPDIVLPKYKIAIFVNGCFWHGHDGCKYYVVPKSNTEVWEAKIKGNKAKDIENNIKLAGKGWKILTVFECELKGEEKRNATLNELITHIH